MELVDNEKQKLNIVDTFRNFFSSNIFIYICAMTMLVFWWFDLKVIAVVGALSLAAILICFKCKLHSLPVVFGIGFCGHRGFQDYPIDWTLVFPISIAVIAVVLFIILRLNDLKRALPSLIKNRLFIALAFLDIAMLISCIGSEYALGSLSFSLGFLVNLVVMLIVYTDKQDDDKYINRFLYAMQVFIFAVMLQMINKVLEITIHWDIEYAMRWKEISLGYLVSNHYIVFITMGIALNLYYIYQEVMSKEYKKMIVNILLLILGFICLVISMCRSAMVALVLMLIFYYVYLMVKHKNIRKPLIIITLAAILLAGILAIILYFRGYFDIWFDSIESFGLLTDRDELWALAWDSFKEHPIFGSGMWSSKHIIEAYGRPEYNYHNYFFQMSQAGILGILALAYYFYALIRNTYGKNKYNIFMLGLLVYWFFHGFFDTLFFNMYLMTYFTMLTALLDSKTIEFKNK